MTLIGMCITLLRVVSVLLAPVLLVMSWRGFMLFGRGRQSMPNTIRSLAFLGALSALIFQSMILVGEVLPAPDSLSLLMSLVLSTSMLIAALIKLSRMQCHPVDELEMIEGHIDVAMAIVELDRMSPDEARVVATECRHRVALLMIEGRVARGG